MTAEVTLIDYGLGNLFSVRRALEQCDAKVEISSAPSCVRKAGRIILPGVGAFSDGMSRLKAQGLDEALREAAKRGSQILGLCLGMQMLFEESEEFGHHEGLGLIRGGIAPIPTIQPNGSSIKIPHIGWNALIKPAACESWSDTILQGISEGTAMYFIHSFMAIPKDASKCLANCRYGETDITAVIGSENVWGTQFHPEKSGKMGLSLLNNYLNLS